MKKHTRVAIKTRTVSIKAFCLGLFLVCIACASQKKAVVPVSDDKSPDTALILLLQDSYSGIITADVEIIKDPSTLKSFFLKINKTRKPGLAMPDVDFTKEMVILVCSGKKSGEVMPALVFMEETDEKMILKIQENKHNDSKSTALTTPFCLYKLPLSKKEISVQ